VSFVIVDVETKPGSFDVVGLKFSSVEVNLLTKRLISRWGARLRGWRVNELSLMTIGPALSQVGRYKASKRRKIELTGLTPVSRTMLLAFGSQTTTLFSFFLGTSSK
jgi:hypothetical protein